MILPYFIIIFPTLLLVFCIRRNSKRPIAAIYAVIAYSYLNLFPTIDISYSINPDTYRFSQIQLLVLFAFEVPLLLSISLLKSHPEAITANQLKSVTERNIFILNPLIIALQFGLVIVFWYVALYYDLYFRRLGFEALERNSSGVPTILLYGYRAAVETSFFITAFSISIYSKVTKKGLLKYVFAFSITLYLTTFSAFFLINSRMQFILMMICIFATTPLRAKLISNGPKLISLLGTLAVAIVLLTVLRELVLEDNNRISNSSIWNLVVDSVGLIAGRLDSVWILTDLSDRGFNPFAFNLSGVYVIWDLYYSFVFDPSHYQQIKNSLETSPSAVIINQLMTVTQIDFPKSMVLDVFLTFGVLGILPLSVAIGKILNTIEQKIKTENPSNLYYIFSLYVIPMVLEFEKETFSILVSVFKWSPVLFLAYLVRPRSDDRLSYERQIGSITTRMSSRGTLMGG